MPRASQRMLAAAAVLMCCALGTAPGAVARGKVKACGPYRGGAAGVVDTFTHVRTRAVGCVRAHEVLGTWANSAPGGTDLGFACAAVRKSSHGTTSIFVVSCHEGAKRITARDRQVR